MLTTSDEQSANLKGELGTIVVDNNYRVSWQLILKHFNI